MPTLSKNGKRIGRTPILSNNDILNRFLDRIAAGNVVRTVCAEEGMPAEDAVYRMVKTDESFRERLARARHDGAYALAESVVEIADSCYDPEMAQIVRNRCDQRRWLAGKFNSAFADKPTGDVNITLSLEQMLAKVHTPEPAQPAPLTIEHEPTK